MIKDNNGQLRQIRTDIASARANPPPSSRIRPHGTLCTTESQVIRGFLCFAFFAPHPPRKQHRSGISSGQRNVSTTINMAAVASVTYLEIASHNLIVFTMWTFMLWLAINWEHCEYNSLIFRSLMQRCNQVLDWIEVHFSKYCLFFPFSVGWLNSKLTKKNVSIVQQPVWVVLVWGYYQQEKYSFLTLLGIDCPNHRPHQGSCWSIAEPRV